MRKTFKSCKADQLQNIEINYFLNFGKLKVIFIFSRRIKKKDRDNATYYISLSIKSITIKSKIHAFLGQLTN